MLGDGGRIDFQHLGQQVLPKPEIVLGQRAFPGPAMASTKATLGAGVRLADFLSAGLQARVVPAEVVHDVLDAHGRNSKRVRGFPAVVGVYYTIALSLHAEAAYEEVFATVSRGLAWAADATEPVRVS